MRQYRPGKSPRTTGFAGLAFEQISIGLRRFLLKRMRDSQRAQDLEQEVYLRLLRMENQQLVRSPEAYIYRIASHLLSQARITEAQSRVDFDSEAVDTLSEEVEIDSPGPEELYDREARERRLSAIVAALPPMQKAVFILARSQGLSHAEIGEQLGISTNTVKKHMLRAINRCRQGLIERQDSADAKGEAE